MGPASDGGHLYRNLGRRVRACSFESPRDGKYDIQGINSLADQMFYPSFEIHGLGSFKISVVESGECSPTVASPPRRSVCLAAHQSSTWLGWIPSCLLIPKRTTPS
jgi:hypothetical protein